MYVAVCVKEWTTQSFESAFNSQSICITPDNLFKKTASCSRDNCFRKQSIACYGGKFNLQNVIKGTITWNFFWHWSGVRMYHIKIKFRWFDRIIPTQFFDHKKQHFHDFQHQRDVRKWRQVTRKTKLILHKKSNQDVCLILVFTCVLISLWIRQFFLEELSCFTTRITATDCMINSHHLLPFFRPFNQKKVVCLY